MFGFLRKGGGSEQEQAEIQEYLRAVRPLVQTLDRELDTWLGAAAGGSRQLSLDGDPDGQHAAVYLWRVTDAARSFVQSAPARAAQRYHEAYSLCLEARGAAADAFKEAADRAGVVDPNAKIAGANGLLAEAERQLARAQAALRELEGRLGGRSA